MSKSYREIMQEISYHSAKRFSEINFDNATTLNQKMNILREMVGSLAKDFSELMDVWDGIYDWIETQLKEYSEEYINELIDNGTFTELLNDKLFGDINKKITALENGKLDKNGLIYLSNLSQEVKEAITGGSVSVVGDNSVYTQSIQTKAVDRSKVNWYSDNLSVNLFDRTIIEKPGGYYNNNNTWVNVSDWFSYKLNVEQQTSYYIRESGTFFVNFYNGETFISGVRLNTGDIERVVTTPLNCNIMKVSVPNVYLNNNDFVINKGNELIYALPKYKDKFLVVEAEQIETKGQGVIFSSDNLPEFNTTDLTLTIPSGFIAKVRGVGYTVVPETISVFSSGWLVFDESDYRIKAINTPNENQTICGYTRASGNNINIWMNGVNCSVNGVLVIPSRLDINKSANIFSYTAGSNFTWNQLENRLYMPDTVTLRFGSETFILCKISNPISGREATLPDYINVTGEGWLLFDRSAKVFVFGSGVNNNRNVVGYMSQASDDILLTTGRNSVNIIKNNNKISYLGDSITNGTGTGKTYWKYIEDEIHKNLTKYKTIPESVNLGVGASCVAKRTGSTALSFVERLNTIPEDTGLLVIFGGTNDYGNSVPLGGLDDGLDTTFLGAYSKIIDYCRTNLPLMKIIVCTPLRRLVTRGDADIYANADNKTLREYVNGIIELSKLKGIPLVDLYSSGLNPVYDGIKTAYMPDGLHPNTEGTEFYYRLILDEIARQKL